MSRPVRTERGITLIEVLVTVVILSIGFLAAARMQVEGMRYSQSAYHQAQAYFMASDMIDRMRANPEGARDGFYDGMVTAAGLADRNCDVAACNVSSLAEQDLFDWSAYIHQPAGGGVASLPSSDGVTARGTITSLGDDQYSIVIRWSELVGGEDVAQFLTLNFAIAI